MQENHHINTRRRHLFSWLAALYQRIFERPRLWVRLRNNTALYPKMSGREIRRVTAAICKLAQKNAR